MSRIGIRDSWLYTTVCVVCVICGVCMRLLDWFSLRDPRGIKDEDRRPQCCNVCVLRPYCVAWIGIGIAIEGYRDGEREGGWVEGVVSAKLAHLTVNWAVSHSKGRHKARGWTNMLAGGCCMPWNGSAVRCWFVCARQCLGMFTRAADTQDRWCVLIPRHLSASSLTSNIDRPAYYGPGLRSHAPQGFVCKTQPVNKVIIQLILLLEENE